MLCSYGPIFWFCSWCSRQFGYRSRGYPLGLYFFPGKSPSRIGPLKRFIFDISRFQTALRIVSCAPRAIFDLYKPFGKCICTAIFIAECLLTSFNNKRFLIPYFYPLTTFAASHSPTVTFSIIISHFLQFTFRSQLQFYNIWLIQSMPIHCNVDRLCRPDSKRTEFSVCEMRFHLITAYDF